MGDLLKLDSAVMGQPDADTAFGPRPTYAGAFRCIGGSCEDTCCRDWAIPVDRRLYQIYKQFPPNRLGSIVAASVATIKDAPETLFARIEPGPSGFCPFFTPERACSIQKEFGASLLTTTCSVYPRALNMVDEVLEGSLYLSCPEAARNVLLEPDATKLCADLGSGAFRIDNFATLAGRQEAGSYKPRGQYREIRSLLIAMLLDRARPMWQRLLLMGSLCKRLDQITEPGHEGEILAMLAEYWQVIREHTLQAELERLPGDVGVKLSVVFRLSDACVNNSSSGRRFRETFMTFVEGISVPVGDDGLDDLQRFKKAEERFQRPFFEDAPHILENYLLNYFYRTLFPFGRAGSPHFVEQGIFDEYILMATQYAWINGLLTGVAAHYREDFGAEHVVKVVQSLSRAVEHSLYFSRTIGDYMRQRRLDSIEGMAVMLKP